MTLKKWLLLSTVQAVLITAALALAWFVWLRPAARQEPRTIIQPSDTTMLSNTSQRPSLSVPPEAFTNVKPDYVTRGQYDQDRGLTNTQPRR